MNQDRTHIAEKKRRVRKTSQGTRKTAKKPQKSDLTKLTDESL